MGPAGLNFRVRDGNGCDPRGVITDKLVRACGATPLAVSNLPFASLSEPIANCQLQRAGGQRLTTEPIGLSTADPAGSVWLPASGEDACASCAQ